MHIPVCDEIPSYECCSIRVLQNFCFCNFQLPWGTSDTAIINRQVVPLHAMKASLHTTHITLHILSAKSLHAAAHGTTWVPHLCMHMAKLGVSHACMLHTAHVNLSGVSLHITNGTWHSMSATFLLTTNSTWHSLNSVFACGYTWHMTCYLPVYSI